MNLEAHVEQLLAAERYQENFRRAHPERVGHFHASNGGWGSERREWVQADFDGSPSCTPVHCFCDEERELSQRS